MLNNNTNAKQIKKTKGNVNTFVKICLFFEIKNIVNSRKTCFFENEAACA